MNQATFNIILLATPIVIGGLIAAINANGINDTTEKVEAWTRKRQQGTSASSGWFSSYIINPILWIIVKFCDWTDGLVHHGLKNGIRIAATLYLIAAWLFILYVAFMIVAMIVITIAIIYVVLTVISKSAAGSNDNAQDRSGTTNMSSDLKHLSPEEKQRAHDEGEKWSKREREGTNGLIESTLPSERSSFWHFDDNRSGGSSDERSKAFDAGADNDKKQNKN